MERVFRNYYQKRIHISDDNVHIWLFNMDKVIHDKPLLLNILSRQEIGKVNQFIFDIKRFANKKEIEEYLKVPADKRKRVFNTW